MWDVKKSSNNSRVLTGMVFFILAFPVCSNSGGPAIWLTANGGEVALPGKSLPDMMLSYGGELAIITENKWVYTLQYMSASEITPEYFADDGNFIDQRVQEAGLLVGRKVRSIGKRFVTLSTGVGILAGVVRGRDLGVKGACFSFLGCGTWHEYERHHFTTVGIPVEGRLYFVPSRLLALGFNLGGELNLEAPLLYFNGSISLGWTGN